MDYWKTLKRTHSLGRCDPWYGMPSTLSRSSNRLFQNSKSGESIPSLDFSGYSKGVRGFLKGYRRGRSPGRRDHWDEMPSRLSKSSESDPWDEMPSKLSKSSESDSLDDLTSRFSQSSMNPSDDREEKVPPSKTNLYGEDESQTKAQRNQPGPGPEPKSDSSKVKVKGLFGHLRIKKPSQKKVKPARRGKGKLKSRSLKKYSCQLTIDTNTVNKKLKLSDNNRKVTHVEEVQSYPEHPDRFDVWFQLLCGNGLTGRCYWEVEWKGNVYISVSYRRIGRKGESHGCMFGQNDHSWSLSCSDDGHHSVWHNNRGTSIPSSSSSSSSVANRVAVYVDVPAETLSFYRVSSGTLIHLHTFKTTFTEPLYPGFWLLAPGSSVFLC